MRERTDMPATVTVTVTDGLSAGQPTTVGALTRLTATADGVTPMSEAATLRLRGESERTRHVFAERGADLVGYAQLTTSDGTAQAELLVAPRARREGVGSRLMTTLLDESGPGLQVWAHGDLPAASALAAKFGMRRVRVLWQMRRPLSVAVPSVSPAAGVGVRAFTPGADDAEWLALNARAFASHPEQGAWQATDLRARQRQAWFDAEGFLLAIRDGAMVGFCWTKVDPRDSNVGELYVVGVDPAAQRAGLGRLLTHAGLQYLRDQGLDEAMLYVDEENAAAIELYRALGFEHSRTDVMYQHGV